MSSRKWLGTILGLSAAVLTAVLVVAAGKTVVGGESPTPFPTLPRYLPVPSISEEERAREQALFEAMMQDAIRRGPVNWRPTPIPTPFGVTPTPTVIRVGDSIVQLPNGMNYLPEMMGPIELQPISGFVYSDETGTSRLYINRDTGEVLYGSGDILPQHAPLFAEVLAALTSDIRPILDSPTPRPPGMPPPLPY